MSLGTVISLWLLSGPRKLGGVTFDVHTLVYAAAAVLLGFQAIAFAAFTKIFAISEGLLPPDSRMDKVFKYVNLELGLLTGVLLTALGLGESLYAFSHWRATHFGPLPYVVTMRVVIPAALMIILGVQTIFSSFFLSVLGLRRR